MARGINFSRAKPLAEYYQHSLAERFEYTSIGHPDYSIFQKIQNNFRITRVEKIYNPQIYGMYLISKKELLTNNPNYNVEEKMLYHATSEDNAINISKNNIDWRMTRRSRFGIGNCFSPCPVYAHRHASRRGVFIVFKVLVQRAEKMENPNYGLCIPDDEECDTICANDDHVYVKYDDNYFYPQYIVHHD